MRAIGYLRVSTEEQASSGLGLDAQRDRVTTHAASRGWDLDLVEDAGFSASNLNRPGLERALATLEAGEAQVLVVAKLDRLSRSILDFAGLMDTARRQGWQVVILDVGADTTTPQGMLLVNVMAAFADYERELIRSRTREALAALKGRGVRLGRPREVPEVVRAGIVAARGRGRSLSAIAEELTAKRVPTAHGGARWYASTVAAVLRSAELDGYQVRRAA